MLESLTEGTKALIRDYLSDNFRDTEPAKRNTSHLAGSWQASAFICAISSWEKKEWSASSGSIHKSPLPLIEKTFPPFANCFSWKIKSFTNFLVLQALCRQKYYLCSDYIPIGCRIFSGQGAQVLPLLPSQNNFKWTFPRHDNPLSPRRYHTLILPKNQEIIRNIFYEMDHKIMNYNDPNYGNIWPNCGISYFTKNRCRTLCE